MRKRLLQVLGVVGVLLAVIVLLKFAPAGSATSAPGSRTAWGDPDLQGIWTDEYQTPLQRPAKYANKELFTDEERAELDRQRAAILRRGQRADGGAPRGGRALLQHRAAQSIRRPRGPQHDGAVHGRGDARLRRLPTDRAGARNRVDFLRRRSGPGMAARHHARADSASPVIHPPAVR